MTREPPCSVRTLGLIQAQPYHSTPVTKDGDVMLTLVIGGRGRCTIPEGDQRVETGMVGLVPGNGQGVLMSDPEDPYLHYYSRFRGEYACDLVRRIRAVHRAPFFPAAGVLELANRLHRHGRISRHSLPRRCGPEGLDVIAILEELLAQAERPETPHAAGSEAQRVSTYLFERVARPTVLDEIAADLGMSRSSLSRMVRRTTGLSVQQLHEQIKIDWAATLMRSTNESVAEIGRRVGYHDQFYFSRVFRKHTGCSPLQWSRSIRQ